MPIGGVVRLAVSCQAPCGAWRSVARTSVQSSAVELAVGLGHTRARATVGVPAALRSASATSGTGSGTLRSAALRLCGSADLRERLRLRLQESCVSLRLRGVIACEAIVVKLSFAKRRLRKFSKLPNEFADFDGARGDRVDQLRRCQTMHRSAACGDVSLMQA
jgi:hypothetical protein